MSFDVFGIKYMCFGIFLFPHTKYTVFGLTSEIYLCGMYNQYLYNGNEIQEDLITSRKLDSYRYSTRFFAPRT